MGRDAASVRVSAAGRPTPAGLARTRPNGSRITPRSAFRTPRARDRGASADAGAGRGDAVAPDGRRSSARDSSARAARHAPQMGRGHLDAPPGSIARRPVLAPPRLVPSGGRALQASLKSEIEARQGLDRFPSSAAILLRMRRGNAVSRGRLMVAAERRSLGHLRQWPLRAPGSGTAREASLPHGAILTRLTRRACRRTTPRPAASRSGAAAPLLQAAPSVPRGHAPPAAQRGRGFPGQGRASCTRKARHGCCCPDRAGTTSKLVEYGRDRIP